MTAAQWTYLTYAILALGAVGLFFALPRAGRSNRAAARLFAAISAGGVLVVLAAGLGNGTGSSPAFYLLALLALAATVRVITHRKPVYSALYFILVVIATAGVAVMA